MKTSRAFVKYSTVQYSSNTGLVCIRILQKVMLIKPATDLIFRHWSGLRNFSRVIEPLDFDAGFSGLGNSWKCKVRVQHS